MKRYAINIFLVVLSFVGLGLTVTRAQVLGTDQAVETLRSDQRSFSELVNFMVHDRPIAERLTAFAGPEADSIRDAILARAGLSEAEKAKAIYSIAYFIHGMRQRLTFTKIEWYDLPEAIRSYKAVLSALLENRPYQSYFIPLSALRSRLLAQAFQAYPAQRDMLDLATLKSNISNPSGILKFLESNRDYSYSDSLLLHVAAFHPGLVVDHLRNNGALSAAIRAHANIYLQRLSEISADPEYEVLMPFIVQLAEGLIGREEIINARKVPKKYFQLMVNTLKSYHRQNSGTTDFHEALHHGIREKALEFYVNQLNEMHSAPKEIRFAPIRDLRMEDIYYIITSTGEDLYTSSYLGLYRKLMEYCRQNSTDSLFRIVNYDRFRDFVRIAANYNTLSDYFSCLATETSTELLTRYMGNLEEDTYTALEKAMDAADCFTGLASDSMFSVQIRNELHANLDRTRSRQHVLGEKLYGILLDVFDKVHRGDKLGNREGYNEVLQRSKLMDKEGRIVGLLTFFGDDDGQQSFRSFRAQFSDSSRWKTEMTEWWIRISTRKTDSVVFYANLPLNHEERLDIDAQDTLAAYLEKKDIHPSILIHRGHSYFINYSMRRMDKDVQLAILGTCGGNNYILDVAQFNPDVQIILSKKIGAMVVNDAIIREVADRLQERRDLRWTEIWNALNAKFSSNPQLQELFREYIPPSRNISLFVMNLFHL